MDESSNDPRRPNGTAAAAAATTTTQTPHSDAVTNILAASPDWRTQAGPSPTADAGHVQGQAAAQAADAGQFVGQAAAPAANAGQQFGAQAAAPGHQGQISSPSQIGDIQTGITNTATGTTAIAAITAATAFNQAATIANQSRSRSPSFATTDFEEAQRLLNYAHAHPSPSAAAGTATATAAGLLTPIPRIVITTPDQRVHAPDSPTLHRPRRRPRRHDLLNRITELENRISSMTEEAGWQEVMMDGLRVDNAMLVGRVEYLEGVVGVVGTWRFG